MYALTLVIEPFCYWKQPFPVIVLLLLYKKQEQTHPASHKGDYSEHCSL